MRKVFAALVLAGLVASFVGAQDEKAKKQDPAKKEKAPVTLKVGDPAPELKATRWLQGDEVKSFEKDKIYVVEFWATWCGPCIVMMPHLSELQQEYKKKGVTFIGFSAKDPRNTEEQVEAFVKKRGEKLKYTFAFEDGRNTHAAWMQAAGQNGIPCCFVVDKASRIAYIGHPMFLDPILPQIVDGTWKAENAAKETQRYQTLYRTAATALANPDAEEGIKTWNTHEAKNPWLASVPYATGTRLNTMLRAGMTAEVKKTAEAMIKKGTSYEDPGSLQTVSVSLRSPNAKGDTDLHALAVKAAKALLEVAGEKDGRAQMNLAETYFATGDKLKAIEHGKRAVEFAPSQPVKAGYEKRLQVFEEQKKPDN